MQRERAHETEEISVTLAKREGFDQYQAADFNSDQEQLREKEKRLGEPSFRGQFGRFVLWLSNRSKELGCFA